MLQLRSAIIAFLLFTSATIFAQDADKKGWDTSNPVQWTDFQGPVDPSSRFAAVTHSGMSYKWHRQVTNGQSQFTFTASSYMDKSKSWVKPGKQTPALLSHESLHFDISEFFARKLLVALRDYPYTSDYKNELNRVYTQMMDARKAMEEKYDAQANHGLNKLKQAEWDIYVSRLLSKDLTYEDALAQEPVD
jgi:hypothetical protein